MERLVDQGRISRSEVLGTHCDGSRGRKDILDGVCTVGFGY